MATSPLRCTSSALTCARPTSCRLACNGDGVGNNRDGDDDGDGVIDILDTRPLDSGVTIIQPGDENSDSSESKESGVITISIQDIAILLAISSAVTITFLWRAKKKESEKEVEKEA